MSKPQLPRIRLGDLEVARLILGTNPVSGFSHQDAKRSRQMVEYFTVERVKQLLRACEDHGIDAVVARADRFIVRVLGEYWREGGAIRWIAQTAPEFADPIRNIRMAAQAGASAIYVHGNDADRLFASGRIDDLRARLDAIHSLGLPAGMAAHEPWNLLEAQKLSLPLDFCLLCLYNLTGYRGRPNEEPMEQFDPRHRAVALNTIRELPWPCLAYKILGAGRLSLDEGLADVGPKLRPGDGILLGMFPPDCPDLVGQAVRRVAEWKP